MIISFPLVFLHVRVRSYSRSTITALHYQMSFTRWLLRFITRKRRQLQIQSKAIIISITIVYEVFYQISGSSDFFLKKCLTGQMETLRIFLNVSLEFSAGFFWTLSNSKSCMFFQRQRNYISFFTSLSNTLKKGYEGFF